MRPKAAGTFGRRERVVRAAAAPAGPASSSMNVSTDDWEPAIAADPTRPFVYMLTTRYAPKPCPGNCPSPWMALGSARRRRDVDATESALRVQGLGAVRPDHRGRPEHRSRLRGLHERLQRGLHEVDEPRRRRGRPRSRRTATFVERQAGRSRRATTAGTSTSRGTARTRGDPWVAQSHDFGRDVDPDEARRLRPLLLRLRRRRRCPTARSCSRRAASSTAARGRPPTASGRSTTFVSTTSGAPGRTSSSTPSSSASRASRPVLARTSTSATAACRPTRRATSCWSTTARTTPGGQQLSSRGDRRTAGRRGRPATTLSTAGEQSTAPTVESRGSRRRPHVVRADERRQPRRVEHLVPELHRRRRDVGGAGEDLRCDHRVPATRRPPGSRSSTATTARSRSRAPGRRSACGARPSATTGPGGTWFNRQT